MVPRKLGLLGESLEVSVIIWAGEALLAYGTTVKPRLRDRAFRVPRFSLEGIVGGINIREIK